MNLSTNPYINRSTVLNLRWLPLLAILCLTCSTILDAQQPASAAGSRSPSTAMSSSTAGLYSTSTSAPDRESAAGIESGSSRAASQTGIASFRSPWIAGANSAGRASAAMWAPGDANFVGRKTSSWVAGAGNFSLDRQQGGIWRLTPRSQVQPNTPNTPIEPIDLSIPSGLTAKGADVLKGARASYSYRAQPHAASGIRGSTPSHTVSSFGSHAPTSSGFGRGVGASSIGHPPTPTLTGPQLHDTPDSDGHLR